MIFSWDENTMNRTTAKSSEKTRRKNIKSQKVARKKILEYLYDKSCERPSFLASLKALKENTALDNSEIKRALRYLKQEALIHLTYDHLEMIKEDDFICKISPGGINEVESRLEDTEKHAGDDTKLMVGRPNLKEIPLKYVIDSTDDVHVKVLTFFCNVYLDLPDYMISLWDLSRGPGLDSSQLREIQLALSFLDDEQLIELQDGSVAVYGKHLNPLRPLGKITYKGLQEVKSLFEGKLPPKMGYLTSDQIEVSKDDEKNILRKSGDFWEVIYQGHNVGPLQHRSGFYYIKILLENPGKEYNHLQLSQIVECPDSSAPNENYSKMSEEQLNNEQLHGDKSISDGIQTLTPETLQRIKIKISGLKEDRNEAERNNDSYRASRIQEEIESCEGYISDVFKGKSRKTGSASERARKNVSKLIRAALNKIGQYDKRLKSHFEISLKPISGYFISYTPDRSLDWSTS